MTECRSSRIEINGAQLDVKEFGPTDGTLVVLLHGFPEDSSTWQAQFAPLANEGFRVLAPNQRGYSSNKRLAIKEFHLNQLAEDVAELITRSDHDSAVVVGHDWGGAVAWWTAMNYPEKVSGLAVINGPHPDAMVQNLLSNPMQLLRSWYLLAFQLPWLPEVALRLNHFALLERAMRKHSNPGSFTKQDFFNYRKTWNCQFVLNGMLNWHRASFRSLPKSPRAGRVSAPTLVIWGLRDHFLCPHLAHQSIEYCEQGTIELFHNNSHWVHREQPDRVNSLLIRFATKNQGEHQFSD